MASAPCSGTGTWVTEGGVRSGPAGVVEERGVHAAAAAGRGRERRREGFADRLELVEVGLGRGIAALGEQQEGDVEVVRRRGGIGSPRAVDGLDVRDAPPGGA